MKTKTTIIVMAMLCLNFFAKAQAVDVTAKGLQIGQEVPNVTLTNLHNYKDASGKVATTAKLSDFKGKLIILDFWATWCAPCVASIPKLERLQKQFEGKLQILPVTYQQGKDVLLFLANLKEKQRRIVGSLPNVFADTELIKLFPHVYLPHYVWIDQKGVVRAITDGKPINELEINNALKENYQNLVKKQDFKIALDKNVPIFINGNGGDGSTMIYHSMLSTYVAGIGAGFSINPPIEGNVGFSKMLAKNVGVMRLFNSAIGNGKYYASSRTIYESKDSLVLDPLRMGDNWRALSWTYELSLPQDLQAAGYQLMHNELLKSFPQYSVKLEKRKTLCYSLKLISGKSIIPSVGGEELLYQNPTGLKMRNGTLNLFINALSYYYYSTSKIPIINLVEDRTRTDLIISASLTNVDAINLELIKYGLVIVKGELEIDMIVYRDALKPSH